MPLGVTFYCCSPCSFLLHRAVTPTFPWDRCSCSTLNTGSRFCVGVDVCGLRSQVEEIGDSDEEMRDGEARPGGSLRQHSRDSAGCAGSCDGGSRGRSPGEGQGDEEDDIMVGDDVLGSVGESSDEV